MLMNWYVVRTMSGHENKVMASILLQADSRNMRDKIGDARIVTETEVQTRAGKRVQVKKKQFPGYVFVYMAFDEDTWQLVKGTPGVHGFTFHNNKPLNPDEVRRFLTIDAEAPQRPKVQWSKDELIRVVSGPFSGLSGKIEEVHFDKEKLRVLISIFGRETPVELDFVQVERG